MAKPTRKHPFLSALQDSPQGAEFRRVIVDFMGDSISYSPLASFEKGRRHLFHIGGDRGSGLLAEAWEPPEGAETRPVFSFVASAPGRAQVFAEYRGRRWDEGSHLAHTGQEAFPGVSRAEAKRLEDQRRRETAEAKDQLAVVKGPHEWESLAGIPRNLVEETIDLHSLPPGSAG